MISRIAGILGGIARGTALTVILWAAMAAGVAEAQVPDVGQWVAIQIGEGGDVEPEAFHEYSYYDFISDRNQNLWEMPYFPNCINSQGETAGEQVFEIAESDENIGVMTLYHPSTSPHYIFSHLYGSTTVCGIGEYYPENESHECSSAVVIGDGGQAAGWAIDRIWSEAYNEWRYRPYFAFWDGLQFHHRLHDDDEAGVFILGINPAGNLAGTITDDEVTSFAVYKINNSGTPVRMQYPATVPPLSELFDREAGAFGLNSTGQCAGAYHWRTGPTPTVYRTGPMIWNTSGVIAEDIYEETGQQGCFFAINDAGHAVGEAYASDPRRQAMAWMGDATGLVLVDSLSDPTESCSLLSINNHDQAVGWSYLQPYDGSADDNPIHALYWDGGEPEDMGSLGLGHSWAYRVTDSGEVFGFAATSISRHDMVVRWTRELGVDGDENGTLDNTENHVVSLVSASGVPMSVIATPGLSVSDVWSTMRISMMGMPGIYDLYAFDTPFGFVHFQVDGLTPGGQTTVTLKPLGAIPFGQLWFFVNTAPHMGSDNGEIFELTSAQWVRDGDEVELHLTIQDGGPEDIDGAANGSIELFGGAVGIAPCRLCDQLLARYLPVTPGSLASQGADMNGDGVVDIADVVGCVNLFGTAGWADLNPPPPTTFTLPE